MVVHPDKQSEHGLDQQAHLVRATINYGNGGERISWVVTGMRPVETSGLVGMNAFNDAKQRFTQRVQGLDNDMQSRLVALQQDRERASADADRRNDPRLFHGDADIKRDRNPIAPSSTSRYLWDPDKKTLRILWAHTRAASWSNRYQVVAPASNCPPGAPCVAPPEFVWERVSLGFGVEAATVYTFDTHGKLSAETHLPLRDLPSRGRR